MSEYELAFIADPQGGGHWAVLKGDDKTEVVTSEYHQEAQDEFDALVSEEELTWEQVLHDVMFAIHNNRRDIK
jgi:hypothetical protein